MNPVRLEQNSKISCICKVKKDITQFTINLLKNKNDNKLNNERDLRRKTDEILRKVKNNNLNKKLNRDEVTIKTKMIELLCETEKENRKPKCVKKKSRIPVPFGNSNTSIARKIVNSDRRKSLIPVPVARVNLTKEKHLNCHETTDRKKLLRTRNERKQVENEVALILTNLHTIITRQTNETNERKKTASTIEIWKYRDAFNLSLSDLSANSTMNESDYNYLISDIDDSNVLLEELSEDFQNLTIEKSKTIIV